MQANPPPSHIATALKILCLPQTHPPFLWYANDDAPSRHHIKLSDQCDPQLSLFVKSVCTPDLCLVS